MTSIAPLTGPSRPAASGETKSIVIMLHGYGADGNDLIDLAPYLSKALPDTAFFSPDAPFPCEMSPFGRQWFSLSKYGSEADRLDPHLGAQALKAVLEDAMKAVPVIDQFIDSLAEQYSISSDKIALLGFSQGTMMSLLTAPRRQSPIAGIVGFSGKLLNAADFANNLKSKMPVTLIHGTSDPVVPNEAGHMAYDVLKENGFDVTINDRPGLGHGIDQEGLGIALSFLENHLA